MKTFLASLLATAAITAVCHADPVLVNGGFEQTFLPYSSQYGPGAFQAVTGWQSAGYNFVYLPGTADTTGAIGAYGIIKLWGPGDGSNNGFTGSPNGGNFLALDGNFSVGAVSQTVTGLTPGEAATVSFYFAGAQQYGYTGATTEQLSVSLGSQTFSTAVLNNPSEGFTGWQAESYTFTPTSSSEVLSFLAAGTPDGFPPMSLLDGVSVSQNSPVPEPSSLALLATGFAGVSGLVRRRFKK